MYLRVAFLSLQKLTAITRANTVMPIACMLFASSYFNNAIAQGSGVFNLSQAVKTGLGNYQNIKAKANYVRASEAQVANIKNQYLPDVNIALQEAFGTINGQFGPSAGLAGIASAGPTYSKQSWNAAFGAVYLLNANWEFVSFGRLRSRIDAAQAQVRSDSANLLQEQFVHSVRVAGTYLNLLIAQRFIQKRSGQYRSRQFCTAVRYCPCQIRAYCWC